MVTVITPHLRCRIRLGKACVSDIRPNSAELDVKPSLNQCVIASYYTTASHAGPTWRRGCPQPHHTACPVAEADADEDRLARANGQ